MKTTCDFACVTTSMLQKPIQDTKFQVTASKAWFQPQCSVGIPAGLEHWNMEWLPRGSHK
jgi:hypothetical protein